jgi:ubiquitin conjugation factor E4 B
VFALLRPETREQMVSWLGTALDLNTARTRMNPDRAYISTDGFLLNVASVLLRLCAPFLDDQTKVRD